MYAIVIGFHVVLYWEQNITVRPKCSFLSATKRILVRVMYFSYMLKLIKVTQKLPVKSYAKMLRYDIDRGVVGHR